MNDSLDIVRERVLGIFERQKANRRSVNSPSIDERLRKLHRLLEAIESHLDELKQAKSSSAPPTVYRALDFLQDEGLVHKIESLNAYVGCGNPKDLHEGQFFICLDCGSVAELDDDDIRELLQKKAKRFGFAISDEMVEIKGHCQECQSLGK